MPTSGYSALGVLNEDGTLKEDVSAATRMGYEYNTQIMANLAEIWKDVEHYNIVGENHDTSGEKGNESGDGTVTYYSATLNNTFPANADNLTVLDLDHNQLVTEYEALEAILSAVGCDAYGKK